jgi:hypothetical protein
MTNRPSSKHRKGWQLACGGCLGIPLLGCFCIVVVGALWQMLRPNARDIYSGAPDLAAGADVSQALIDSGVQGASVLVIPIKGTSGQIAIITLDESRGFIGFSAGSADNLQIVVNNIVQANRQGDYHIEQLSIDYRDASGESSLAFTATMSAAESYAVGAISRREFIGNVDFNLTDTLRYFGIDQILQEMQP